MGGVPRVTHADHVGFSVASLDAALAFWVEGFGATLLRRGSVTDRGFIANVTGAAADRVEVAFVELAGQTVELLEYRPTGSTGARPSDPGMAHLALFVESLDAATARAVTYGWRPNGPAQTMTEGPRAGTRVAYLVAPDGGTVEFLEAPST